MSTITAPKSNSEFREFSALEFTKDVLTDVIKMITDGNIVALHTTSACRAFYNLPEVNLFERRVVYFDCNACDELLSEGEWEYHIHERIQSVIELPYGDALRDEIIKQRYVPHRAYIELDKRQINSL